MDMRAKSILPSLFIGVFVAWACSSMLSERETGTSKKLNFGPAQTLGNPEKNPSTPFLRSGPDGRRLYAVWSEDHDVLWPAGHHHSGGQHRMDGDRGPSPMRNAFVAWSEDTAKSWSPAKRVNSKIEAVQGEENGPKVAIGKDNQAYIVWSRSR
jgi:hypothetical protein